MAKVEMDLSEYKAMEEVKKALQDSLDKERELNEEVKKLRQEKIDALKANEKKVTVVKRVEKWEAVMIKRSTHELLTRLSRIFGYNGTIPPNAVSHYASEHEYLINTFFEKTDMRPCPDPEETITHCGFDQVKEDLREEIRKQEREGVEYDLERVKSLTKENKGLNKELRSYRKIEGHLLEKNNELSTEIDRLKKDVEGFTDKVNELLKLSVEAKIKGNIFNYKSKFRKLAEILNK